MSDELKNIYRTGQVRIVEDVDLSVDIVEKIVSSISPENVNKTPEVRKFSSKGDVKDMEQTKTLGFYQVK